MEVLWNHVVSILSIIMLMSVCMHLLISAGHSMADSHWVFTVLWDNCSENDEGLVHLQQPHNHYQICTFLTFLIIISTFLCNV